MKTINLLHQTTILGLIGSTVLFTPSITHALTVEEVTNPRQDNGGWLVDMANILSNSTEIKLNNLIANFEQSNGTEIAVVTVPETTPADSPKTFATELFNYWGIGKAASNNGVLFLVSMEDKRVEITTGTGIANLLSDAEVAQIIDTKITPQYEHQNFDRGTLDGTEALISTLQSSVNHRENSKSLSTIDNQITLLLRTKIAEFMVVFIIALVLGWISKNSQKRKERNRSSKNYYTGCNSNINSSSYSFNSSGSFGGGSSDGGGAGGDF